MSGANSRLVLSAVRPPQSKRGRLLQVLIVCTGNTCRSPMAEGILRSLLSPDLAERVHVRSAGTGAIGGVPATALAVRTTAERGIDIGGHRSTTLTAALVREADLVLAMEPDHVSRARELAPEAEARIHLITKKDAEAEDAVAPRETGVRDPIGGAAREYEDTYHRIRSHLLHWLPTIREAVLRQEGVR